MKWQLTNNLQDHSATSLMALIISMIMARLCIYMRYVKKIEAVSNNVTTVSEATVCRILRRHGFTRKKVHLVALQRRLPIRAMFMVRILSFRREMLVFVDETGSDARNYIRKCGYSLRGERAECHKLLVRGARISAIGALAPDGILAVEFTRGTVKR